MERYLNPFKARAVYTYVNHIEKSFVRNTEATERCLLQNRARHGCVSLYVRAVACGDKPACTARGAGRRITEKTSTAVRGLSRISAVSVLRVALATMGRSADELGAVGLDHAVLMVHTGATVNGLKFDSRQTPNRSGRSRSYQNSFGRVAARGVVSTQLGPDGLVQSYPRHRIRKPDTDSIIRGSVYVHVECYVQIHEQGSACNRLSMTAAGPESRQGVGGPGGGGAEAGCGAGSTPSEVVLAVVQVLRNAKAEVFSGTQTVVTEAPVPSSTLAFEDLYLVPLESFQAQLLQLTAADEVTALRFIECQGKLDQL